MRLAVLLFAAVGCGAPPARAPEPVATHVDAPSAVPLRWLADGSTIRCSGTGTELAAEAGSNIVAILDGIRDAPALDLGVPGGRRHDDGDWAALEGILDLGSHIVFSR
jgi:hypothetical protein